MVRPHGHYRELAVILALLVLSLFLRFIFLDRVPNAITGDELIYALTAKSVSLTGTDLSGAWHPSSLLFFRYPPGELQAELPYFLVMPFVSAMPFSLFWLRFPYAVIGSFVPVFVYLIASKMLGRKTGAAAGALTAINPWLIFISRSSYEMILATCIFLAALYFAIRKDRTGTILSGLFFILGFLSYIGTKPIAFLLAAAWGLYVYGSWKKRPFRNALPVIMPVLILTGYFMVTLLNNPGTSRIGDVVSTQGRTVFQLAIFSVQKFVKTFSPDFLFLHGDNFFSLLNHGLFYILDLPFILLGSVWLWKDKRREAFFLWALVIIGVIPELLFQRSSEHFSPHITVAVPFLLVIGGYGMIRLTGTVRPMLSKYVIAGTIIALYVFQTAIFMQMYLMSHPLSDSSGFHERLLSRYITDSTESVVVESPSGGDLFRKHLFYANLLTPETIGVIRSSVVTRNYAVGNVRFVPCGQTERNSRGTVITDVLCGGISGEPDAKIVSLTDGGTRYAIRNDQVCRGINLKSYPSGLTLNDFDIRQLTKDSFCRAYITSSVAGR